jgi:hypothetical protein
MVMAKPVSSPPRKFRDEVAKNNDTVYQAECDGLVEVQAVVGSGRNTMSGFTDPWPLNPPTTLRQGNDIESEDSAGSRLGFTMSVKKGDYWKVTGCTQVFWRPNK